MATTKRGRAALLAAVIAAGGMVVPIGAEARPVAAAVSAPEITFPADGSTVDQGALTVRGSLARSGEDVSVLYVVDVSGFHWCRRLRLQR